MEFTLEVWSENSLPKVGFNLFQRPETATIQLIAGLHFAIVNSLVCKDEFLLSFRFKNVSGEQFRGEIGDVIKFIAEIRKIEPVLSWRRLDLRPDRRFRMNTGVGSANLAARVNELPPTRLNFNGALRILGYDGKWSAKELGITRPDWREIARKSESRRRFPVMRAPDRRIGEKVPAAAAKPAANPAAGKADGGKK